ncbi:MAG: hypothetical protein RIR51_1271 [Bacteroidota bacterium]
MNKYLQELRIILYGYNQGINKIILANVCIFLLLSIFKVITTLSSSTGIFNEIFTWLALPSNPKEFIFKPWTIVTYFFVHIDLFHILFNMLFLYWFGTLLKDFIGEKSIIQTYFLGALSAGIIYLIIMNNVGFFVQRGQGLLNGASGGIYAIVVGLATIKPYYKIRLLFFGMVPIIFIAAFYVIWSFIETTGNNAGGNIAHLGGALYGLFFGLKFKNKISLPRKEKVFSIFQNEDKYSNLNRKKNLEDPIDDSEIDDILDKISKSGYDSLTKFEKKRLFKASQKNE